ncbi:EPIDERMAL PATTERNING FACTOR-like protein 1 isoform X1 [Durio zibethinus]|uniref:Epidermal patterning factor-like protein n=1 Tax=Durio zibethinus TaxID=66656 RepID=A0A6P5ZHM3_DURZI|nr:EPIDERMAL PATTERNING FACTOR-like protein 1 isoform X1 [Durio zibethinus]
MIIMSSLVSLSLYISTLVISLCFHLLLSPASSFRQPQPPNSPDWVSIEAPALSLFPMFTCSLINLTMVLVLGFQQVPSFEEKTRLGSTPPSCHNKCNGCHPCMAVQVPTLPSHDRFQPGLSKAITNSMQFFDPSGNQYSNYKPLGWKCRCGDRFYNP